MSKFDSPSERTGLVQSSTFSSESCLGEYTQMRDRLKKLLSPKNSDDLYELLLLLKNADLFGRETVSKIDILFSEIANCTPDDDLTHIELADCFISTLLSYIDDEYFLELLQNIILHTKNNSLTLSCENRLFELIFVLGMGVIVDKLRNPLGLVYVLLKSSNFFNLKFMSSKVSLDESRVNLGYLLCTQILNSMLASSSLYTFNFSSNFEQNEVYTYITSLKLDNRNLKEFLNKEYFAKICEQIVYYCGPFTNNLKFLENLIKICKFIHSKDINGNKNYRNLTVSILSQRFVNPLFQSDLILTFLENMYNELLSIDLKDFESFSLNFKNIFGFTLNNIFNSNYINESNKLQEESNKLDEYKHEDELDSQYGEEKLLKSDLFFNLFPSVNEEELIEIYWILETDLLFALFQTIRTNEHSERFCPLFLNLFKNAKNNTIFSRALIFKLSLIWSDYQNFGRSNYNPISLKMVTMNEQFWFLFENSLSNLVPKKILLTEMKEYKDDFKDKRCEFLYDFILNIAIHTDSDCFFIVLLELLRFSTYDFYVLKYSLQMFQSTLLEFFKHNRVRFSKGVLEIVCFCRQYFDWGFMTMLIYSIDCMITGDSDKFAKIALSDGLIDYLTWKLHMETEYIKNTIVENSETDTDTSVVLDNNDIDDQNNYEYKKNELNNNNNLKNINKIDELDDLNNLENKERLIKAGSPELKKQKMEENKIELETKEEQENKIELNEKVLETKEENKIEQDKTQQLDKLEEEKQENKIEQDKTQQQLDEQEEEKQENKIEQDRTQQLDNKTELDRRNTFEEEILTTRFIISSNIIAEIFYIINHLVGPTDIVLELFFLYNQHVKGLSSYNILLLPLYKGIEEKLKDTDKQINIDEHIELGLEEEEENNNINNNNNNINNTINKDNIINYNIDINDIENRTIQGRLDLSDRTQFSLGPNKDIYGYLLLNEDSELTTSHVVTLIFSGKMSKNVLNAIKLLNSEEGSRSQYILDLILRKFINKLQQLFLINVSEEFCLHINTNNNYSQEEELLIRNLRLLSIFLSGLVSLHINSIHIDSIYLIFRTLLECLKSETVFLVEFSMMTFNNIKNLYNYPMFTKEFISDTKVSKFYPNLIKNYKTILNSSDSISEIETTLDQNIANEVINIDKIIEDKCLKGKINTKGVIIIKTLEEGTIDTSTISVSSLPSSTSIPPTMAPTSITPTTILNNYDILLGLCNNIEYEQPKIHPLFYYEQCLITIMNMGIDDFFNTLKLQIEVPDNNNETINIFSTFTGTQFVSTIESLVLSGHIDWLFFLILRHAIIKGESSFIEINKLLQTLGNKMIDYFVKFLSFAVNLFLKYMRSCRALLVYKKILLICASLLGEFTISRNKPLLLKHLNIRQFLSFSYDKGFLSIAVPFVCRLMTYVIKSKLFKLPNPWTFCILSLLNEIKNVKNLKQILIAEINNLILLLTNPKNQQQNSSPLQTAKTTNNTIDTLNNVMKSNIVGSNINCIGTHIKDILNNRVLAEYDQSCKFSSNIWSNSNETKLKIPPISHDIKLLLKRKIIINNKLLTNNGFTNTSNTNITLGYNNSINTNTLGINTGYNNNNNTNNIINTMMNSDLYNLILNAIESCYRESIFIIEKIVPICVSTCGVISKIDFTQDISIDMLKKSLSSMTTGLSTSLVNVICKEVLLSILSSEIYLSLLNQYTSIVNGINNNNNNNINNNNINNNTNTNNNNNHLIIQSTNNNTNTGLNQTITTNLGSPGINSGFSGINTSNTITNNTTGIKNMAQKLITNNNNNNTGLNQIITTNLNNQIQPLENYPVFDCIWLEYISQILARDNLALVCALVEQLTMELMGRSLDEMINNWTTTTTNNNTNISNILYTQFISTLHTNNTNTTNNYYMNNNNNLRNTEELSLLYKKYLSLVPSTIARVERTEKRPPFRFPDYFIVPPIETIPTNLVVCKFDEFEQRLKEAAKYLLMYPPIVPMANCKFLYKCESSSLLLLSFLPKNHQIFTLLWSIHYIIIKSINITECYELVLNRVIKNISDSKAVSIVSIVNEVELSLLEMLCVDNTNLLNITTSLLPNLTFNKLVLFLRFKLIKIPSLDVYLCNSGDIEFIVKMVYRLIIESNYVTLKELPLSLKFLSKFDKNLLIHSIGSEPTKLSVILAKLFAYSNQTTNISTNNIGTVSVGSNITGTITTTGQQTTTTTTTTNSGQVDRLVSLRLLFMSRPYFRNSCVVQTEVSKKHINMYLEFLNAESDSEIDLFFINFNENPIDQFITSSLLLTLYASYQPTNSVQNLLDPNLNVMGKNAERERDIKRFDGIPRVIYGNPNLEYVPLFCKLVNGFIQSDVFILQKVLHILLSVLYKNYCLPVFFKIIHNFIFNPNYTFSAHVSISQFLLYCNPTEMANFAPFWVQLATSKQLVQSLIQSPTEWPTLSQLIRYVLIYCSSTQSNSHLQLGAQMGLKDGKNVSIDALLENILNILLYLLQICPEFICGYYLSFCEVTTSIRFRNIFTFSTPKTVKCSNPLTATEISESLPLSFVNHIQYIIQKPTLKALTDAYISDPSDRLVGLILKELQPDGIVIYYTLYLGCTLPLLISKMGMPSSNPNSQIPLGTQLGMGQQTQLGASSVKVLNCYLLLEKLLVHSKSKLLISSMLLHIRYPNLVTIRFITFFKNLFERAENIQELIITSILERLLVKPHPWGVVHLLFQLTKFKKFWTFVQTNKQLEEHLKKIRHIYISS